MHLRLSDPLPHIDRTVDLNVPHVFVCNGVKLWSVKMNTGISWVIDDAIRRAEVVLCSGTCPLPGIQTIPRLLISGMCHCTSRSPRWFFWWLVLMSTLWLDACNCRWSIPCDAVAHHVQSTAVQLCVCNFQSSINAAVLIGALHGSYMGMPSTASVLMQMDW